jgi:hypothetical protein
MVHLWVQVFCDLLIHYKRLDQCFVSKYQCVFLGEYNKCGHIDGIDLLEMHVSVISIHNVNNRTSQPHPQLSISLVARTISEKTYERL